MTSATITLIEGLASAEIQLLPSEIALAKYIGSLITGSAAVVPNATLDATDATDTQLATLIAQAIADRTAATIKAASPVSSAAVGSPAKAPA